MVINIAGHAIGADIRSEVTRELCHDYLCDAAPEMVLRVNDEELAPYGTHCRPEEREFYALHGKIASYLLQKDTLLFHGSCLSLDGNGILFTAPSGTGKSTHARLWRERFGSRVAMLNDDKPMLHLDRHSGQWTAFGSPWCGKERIHTNISAPLRCIVVLHQAPENNISRLMPREATVRFLQQAYMPAHDLRLKVKAIDLVARLAEIPVYDMGCTISQEAVDITAALITNNIP